MTYQVNNLTATALSVGSHTFTGFGSKTVDFLDSDLQNGISQGYLSVTGVSAAAVTTDVITLTDNTGGTASATLAVIADAPTANALASLAAVVNQLTAQVNSMRGQVNAIDVRVNE